MMQSFSANASMRGSKMSQWSRPIGLVGEAVIVIVFTSLKLVPRSFAVTVAVPLFFGVSLPVLSMVAMSAGATDHSTRALASGGWKTGLSCKVSMMSMAVLGQTM